jgi:hypothetical protein
VRIIHESDYPVSLTASLPFPQDGRDGARDTHLLTSENPP